MQAAQQLATLSGDAATAAKAKSAFDTGVAATANLLWNASIGYFRGYTGGYVTYIVTFSFFFFLFLVFMFSCIT